MPKKNPKPERSKADPKAKRKVNRKAKICSICGINAKQHPKVHMRRYHAAPDGQTTNKFQEWDPKGALPPEPFCANLEAVLREEHEPKQSQMRDGRWTKGNKHTYKPGHIHPKSYPSIIYTDTKSYASFSSLSQMPPNYD